MRERPILFSGPMVRAILEGRKTMTRRIIKGSTEHKGPYNPAYLEAHKNSGGWAKICPFGAPGDTLWVREQLTRPDGDPWLYAADRQPVMVSKVDETAMLTWAHHKEQDYCPSIHMPRWASRITLEITGVRVERLQGISEADAEAEGIRIFGASPVSLATAALAAMSPMRRRDFMKSAIAILLGIVDVLAGKRTMTNKESFALLWSTIHKHDGPNGWAANPWAWVIEFKRLEARA